MVELIDYEVPASEPITLQLAKSFCSIDQDYKELDRQLETMILETRKYFETQLNMCWAKRTVKMMWDGRTTKMPLYPVGKIISVEDSDGNILEADKWYKTPYQKSEITIREVEKVNAHYWYNINGSVEVTIDKFSLPGKTYVVTYECGLDSVPRDIINAMGMQLQYVFDNAGQPGFDQSASGIIRGVLHYSNNLVL